MAADTGDAPATYGAASHEVISNGPFLGVVPPDDNSLVATTAADGDDLANGDDEDGVTSFSPLFQNIKAYSLNVLANNPTAAAVNLVGWIDFDGNGSFEADEGASVSVPAGNTGEVVLDWPTLTGITTDYAGTSYARLRITSDTLGLNQVDGSASDGEVEDYAVEILNDSDGDELPDNVDPDDDNDGIPDVVEVIGVDTDSDGTENYLDTDSDNDGISDLVEAGPSPETPVDSDSDGVPDYLDLDSNNDGTPDGNPVAGDDDGDGLSAAVEGAGDSDGDGILNINDIDSDNDTIPDAVEAVNTQSPIDTDGDGVADFLDLDSDNDGIPDLYEASAGGLDSAALDTDGDGRVDGGSVFGTNGLVDSVETAPDSGLLIYQLIDTDSDGARDYVDTDSDNDTISDTIESGGQDADANGVVDALSDQDGDGVPDNVDADLTGGLDDDTDSIDDAFDSDFATGPDTDLDGIIDAGDLDVDGDGVVDGSNAVANSGALLDDDNDGIPNFQDDDSNGVVTPAADVPRIETGLSGYAGCSILPGTSRGFDPVFTFLMLMAFGILAKARRKNRIHLLIRSRSPRQM